MNIFCVALFCMIQVVLCSFPGCQEEIPDFPCDYIIVGVGTAGSVIASRLSENPDVTVCGLEAGPQDTDHLFSPLAETPRFWTGLFGLNFSKTYTTEIQKGLNNLTRSYAPGRVLGGTSTVNGMIYFRGFKADFDRWAARGATGWSYNDVLPYFLKSENMKSPPLQNSPYHDTCGPLSVIQDASIKQTQLYKLLKTAAEQEGLTEKDCNEPSPFGYCHIQWTMEAGRRESASSAFLRPAMGRTNLFIITEALVDKVLVKGGVATGVKFTKNGVTHTLKATKEVIVSAGTFESPAVLQRSGIGPSTLLQSLSIPVKADLPVGENFHDHMYIAMQIGLDIPAFRFETLKTTQALNDYVTKREGPYNQGTGVQTMFFNLKTEAEFDRPEIQAIFADGNFSSLFNPNDLKADGILPRSNSSRNGTGIIVINLQPKSRGTVKIRSRNPEDQPRVDPKFLDKTEDVDALLQAYRKIEQLSQTPAMQASGARMFDIACGGHPANSNESIACVIPLATSGQQHAVGTCKMGSSNDPTAVVDPNLRVIGINKLRVADASIMPDITSSYIQAVVMMIGEKAADMIMDDVSQK